jgi:hypothetical protein
MHAMGLRHRVRPRDRASLVILLSTSVMLVAGTGLAGSDELFAIAAPQVVRDSVMERAPGFVIWTIRTTRAEGSDLHEITVFDPARRPSAGSVWTARWCTHGRPTHSSSRGLGRW